MGKEANRESLVHSLPSRTTISAGRGDLLDCSVRASKPRLMLIIVAKDRRSPISVGYAGDAHRRKRGRKGAAQLECGKVDEEHAE